MQLLFSAFITHRITQNYFSPNASTEYTELFSVFKTRELHSIISHQTQAQNTQNYLAFLLHIELHRIISHQTQKHYI